MKRPFAPHQPADVANAVRAVCAVELEWLENESDDGNWVKAETSSLDLDDDDRCGWFQVHVYASPALPPIGERGEFGVAWMTVPSFVAEELWAAFKVYGNVELIWMTRSKTLDAKWHALDKALASLP